MTAGKTPSFKHQGADVTAPSTAIRECVARTHPQAPEAAATTCLSIRRSRGAMPCARQLEPISPNSLMALCSYHFYFLGGETEARQTVLRNWTGLERCSAIKSMHSLALWGTQVRVPAPAPCFTTTHISSSRGPSTLFWTPQSPAVTHACAFTHTQIRKNKKKYFLLKEIK